MQEFTIGDFFVEPSKGQISNRGEIITIEPKAMAVLCQLYKNRGSVVSQQELFEHVWPNSIFSPSSLQRTVTIIRKALKESSQAPNFLFTHPKLGYRLEVPDNEASANPRAKLVTAAVTALVLIFFVIINLVNKPKETKAPYAISPLTFSENGEFNGQLSPTFPWFSFLQHNKPNEILISSIDAPQNIRSVSLPHKIIDYVWQQDSIIALLKTEVGNYKLGKIMSFKDTEYIDLGSLSQWQSISELEISDNSQLWFVGLNQIGEYHLVKHNLITRKTSPLHTLGVNLLHASLTLSDTGLYFQTFDSANQQQLGLYKFDNSVHIFDIISPDILDLAWDKTNKRLIVSDLLTSNLYVFTDPQLIPLDANNHNVLNNLSINANHIIATEQRQDMDIISWQGNGFKTLVDSKYADYLASKSSLNDIAFVSNRIGHPQVYLTQESQTQLIYENQQELPYLSPVVWSPNGEKLAFSANQKIVIYDRNTQTNVTFDSSINVKQVLSWANDSTLIINSRDNKVYTLSLVTRHPEALELNSPMYVAIDHQESYITVNSKKVTWGNNQKQFEFDILRAFKLKTLLAVEAIFEEEHQLLFINKQLEVIKQISLSSKCAHITDVVTPNEFLCTSFSPMDSQLVLIKRKQ